MSRVMSPSPSPARINDSKVRLIHVARRQLGLSEDDYRAVLSRVAGVASSKNLTDDGFRLVMEAFGRLGFVSTSARRESRRRGNSDAAGQSAAPTFGIRPGMASPRQVEMIRGLWREFSGSQASDATLGRWLERTFHVSSIRFLSYDDAHKAIGALKTMKTRKAA